MGYSPRGRKESDTTEQVSVCVTPVRVVLTHSASWVSWGLGCAPHPLLGEERQLLSILPYHREGPTGIWEYTL